VTALTIPVFAFFTVLTVLVLAAGLRRLMGMRLSPLRTLIAALIALFSASPIITAMAGPALSSQHPGVLPNWPRCCRCCAACRGGSTGSAARSRTGG
jgi:sorbitol-specific phosphotransferase system component IIBC